MPLFSRPAPRRFFLTSLLLCVVLAATAGSTLADGPMIPAQPGLLAAAIPQATYGIRGSLDAGYVAYYGPYYEQPGAELSLDISYTPASAAVQLGLCTAASFGSCFSWQSIPSGGGGAAWQVTQAGTFYLAIWNQGPGTIDYTGTLQA
jgi:hypothetical protein